MLRFFKYLFASFLGVFFAIGILSAIGIYLVFSTVNVEDKIFIQENSVLKLDLSGQIVEYGDNDVVKALNKLFNESNSKHSLIDITTAIREASKDDKIKGIHLVLGNVSTGFAILEEIYTALQEFKNTGKFIYTYGLFFTEKTYYLASLCDKIFLTPEGLVEFDGFVVNKMFLRDLFDKHNIKPEIFKVGEYKSAIETFSRNNISPEDRKQTQSYLNGLYNYYLKRVGEALDIPVDSLTSIANSMAIRKSSDALDKALVTNIGYKNDFNQALREALNLTDEESINYISYEKYLRQILKPYSSNKIAVVIAEGSIVMNQKSELEDGIISGYDLSRTLEKLRKNDNIKAIVLRINSPGGSALASDLIWNEIELLKEVKPVIASYSDYAASGGYYIGMGADVIISHPNTITGSIGVFGVTFNLEPFFNEYGITFDQVETGPFANIGSSVDEFSQAERQIIQSTVDNTYETFTSKAAKGRKKTIEEIKKVAGGRVWTGKQALEIGLVDKLGTLDDAIRLAAEKAGIQDDFKIIIKPDIDDDILNFLTKIKVYWIKQQIKNTFFDYQSIREIQNFKGIQARMPFIIIK